MLSSCPYTLRPYEVSWAFSNFSHLVNVFTKILNILTGLVVAGTFLLQTTVYVLLLLLPNKKLINIFDQDGDCWICNICTPSHGWVNHPVQPMTLQEALSHEQDSLDHA